MMNKEILKTILNVILALFLYQVNKSTLTKRALYY